jgi:hypothetical protein
MSESAGTNLGRLNTQRNLLLKLDPQKKTRSNFHQKRINVTDVTGDASA